MTPKFKAFYQVYRRGDNPSLFIGKGPDKIEISKPEPGFELFVKDINGVNTEEELRNRYPQYNEWMSALQSVDAISFQDNINIDDPYSRQMYHFCLYEKDEDKAIMAQEKLKQSHVVVLGVGAGGSTLLRFLTAVGIGNVTIVDFDTLDQSNLATHTTIDWEDVGKPKINVMKEKLLVQNPNLNLNIVNTTIENVDDIVSLVKGADFFLQAFDYPLGEATTLANKASIKTGVPFSSIGVTDKGARCGPIVKPHQTGCMNCFGLTPLTFLHKHEAAALMGTQVAMLASIMVHEVVKVITGISKSKLEGNMLYINTETLSFDLVPNERMSDCGVCGG